jgi:CubicO group peptidase (beta-lactamase class C family)
MTPLQDFVDSAVTEGTAPGAAALVEREGHAEVAAAGELHADSIVRIASLTKPITSAALMLLVDEGRVGLEDPVARWLPELAEPQVVRTAESPLDDVVPAARPITVEDVLTSRAGWGFPSDFSLPAVVELFQNLPVFGAQLAPDEWIRTLAGIPMLSQPGEAWLYNTCSEIQGVLIARVAGRSFPEFLAERVFEPLGMSDTGFQVPREQLGRLVPMHRNDAGPAIVADWSTPPVFASGGGGLLSTLADWRRFGRMLLDGGGGLRSPGSVRLLMTDHLTSEQRDASTLFLEGAGWGYGGSVAADGRYGWIGGTGTTAHVHPASDTIGILFTQVQMTGPTPTPLMRRFWDYAFAESH